MGPDPAIIQTLELQNIVFNFFPFVHNVCYGTTVWAVKRDLLIAKNAMALLSREDD